MILINPKNLQFFFFNDTATTEIYTLSLHDALPISEAQVHILNVAVPVTSPEVHPSLISLIAPVKRSEEHTSELQSQSNLVCRLLLEKKKSNTILTRRLEFLYILKCFCC